MANSYAFRAATRSGQVDTGTLDAESLAGARAVLATRDLFVLELVDHGPHRSRRAGISAADLGLGLRILADLFDSGLPVTRALQAFGDLAPKSWHAALPSIQQSVKEGKGFATALAESPIEIPPLVIGIARAGEAGSGIGAAIRRGAELTEAAAETQAAIRTALAYPAVVAFAGFCSIAVLLTVVLPRFAAILADLGQALPLSTQIVLRMAAFGRVALLPTILIAIIVGIAIRATIASDTGKRRWDRALLAVPFFGGIRRGAAVSRMTHSLGALLDSGVTLASALTFAARAAGDAELQARVIDARTRVVAGETLARAFDLSGAATPMTVRLIRAGEESGRLSSMLTHAARIEQQRADRIIRSVVRLLEPALLLAFASIVAFVAAALLQAIYSVRPGA